MSIHNLKCVEDSFGDIFFTPELFLNYINSNIKCELNSYYIHKYVFYEEISELISCFDSFLLNFKNNMRLSKTSGDITIYFSINLDLDKHIEFLGRLIHHISSHPLNYYKRADKNVNLLIDIHDDSSDYDDLIYLKLLERYFDSVVINFVY